MYRFRDNFSVTSNLIVTTIFSVTENSSQAEFDNRLFSFQQPLRFAALSTSPCTGEAFKCGICALHYQFDFELIFDRRRCDFTFSMKKQHLYVENCPRQRGIY